MPKMRLIKAAVKEILENDPQSAISEHFLRMLLKTNKIKHVRAGNRYIVDLSAVEEYLAHPPIEERPINEFRPPTMRVIR